MIRREWQRVAKRGIDILGSALGLVVLLPVNAAIAAAIKLEDRGPIFFNATRVGQGGVPFRMYKFRTMVVDAEARLAELQHLNLGGNMMVKIANDPRVTRIGGMLRPTHLDEIPQLWNVLKGDMSLVGPRPQYPREVAHYTPQQQRRLDVRPGITGLCQICAPHSAEFEVWTHYDLEYIKRWSLLLDLRILARTLLLVLGEPAWLQPLRRPTPSTSPTAHPSTYESPRRERQDPTAGASQGSAHV
ncbi:MAG: sugar transferase [Chloroflexi bacterium]|nr:sugar transferase [Chloroflexota bacterium]